MEMRDSICRLHALKAYAPKLDEVKPGGAPPLASQ
jgi:hypothetical protein